MSKRANPEINAGSMADIAFLLLIFFLVTTTMNVDSGIMRTLPPIDDTESEIKMKKRNILFVSINARDQILLNLTEPVDLSQIKERTKKFILNADGDSELPEVEVQNVEGIGNIRVSKATVSLQNTSGTSYDIYVKVQNELTRAYNEIREDYAQRYFGTTYAKLDKDQLKAIRDAVPLRISEAEPKF